MKSIRDIYKIGAGPSSSHTMGPEAAARLFKGEHPEAEAFRAILYGSLSKTGKGHGTDRAIIQTMSPVPCEVIFSEDELPEMKHPNTMDLIAVSAGEETVRQRFYSIGGGDIRIEGQQTETAEQDVYMENSFAEIKQFCQCSYIDLLRYIEINEADDIWGYLGEVWQTMKNAIRTGLSREGILFWAVVIGLGLKMAKDETVIHLVDVFSNTISTVVGWVIQCAPFGILGVVFTAVSTNGLSIFTTYGKLILELVGTMLMVMLIANPLIMFLCTRKNPYPLIFTCIRESAVSAFFTRSSAANIPINMALCEKLGLDRDFYSVSIPLGSTINMDGAAVVITIMSLTLANTLGIQVPAPMAILLAIISTLGACGTSGVAGGSLLLIPMACSLLGIPGEVSMQMVAVGFVISVIQDSMETALNSSSDVAFTATAEIMTTKKK